MVVYDETFTVAVLKAKCKELGLPIYGRKKDLIERLNKNKNMTVEVEQSVLKEEGEEEEGEEEEGEEEEVHLHLSPTQSDDEEFKDVSIHHSILESNNEVDYVATVKDSNKRKRIVFDYKRDDTTHESLEAALIVIKEEDYWNKLRARELKFGAKLDYVCRFQECLMKLNVELSNANETAIIWRTTGLHNHTETESNKPQIGINPITKAQVDLLFQSSVVTAKRIQIALRDRVDPYLPKKFESDPNVNSSS